jgi:4-hydroxyacetophenone monooxygenase
VGIVGGGISGLLFASHLANLELDVKVFEQKSSPGGTWAGPRYPGQRVDIAGHVYWPTQFGSASWKTVFPTGRELADGLVNQTRKLESLCSFAFNSTVRTLEWQHNSATWKVQYLDRRSQSAFEEEFDFLVVAPGKLSSPAFPLGLGGNKNYGQHSHSLEVSRQDPRKPICVVGSAASGIQLATELSMEGRKVHLFQRSASWILPTPNYRQESSPIIQELQRGDHLFSLLYRLFYLGKSIRGNLDSVIVEDGAKDEVHEISEKNYSWQLELEDYIQSRTSGTQLPPEWLIPSYPPGSRRLVLDDGEYLGAVLDGRIVLHGASDIRNADDVRSVLRIADSVPENIVWATGFNPRAWTEKISVVGETKESMKSLIYKSGLHYKGVMIPGYPNLFLAWGPNSNVVVSGSNTHMMELQAEFTGKVISEMANKGHNRVSVGRDVSEAYARQIASKSLGFAWGASSVKSWYKTNEGLSIENWPGDTVDYFKELFVETLDGLDFS